MIRIHIFEKEDRDEVIKLALFCQNDGSRPLLSINDQLDLLDIEDSYLAGGGCFWVAKDHGKVAGSLGLMNGGGGIGILKKFFIVEPYRGNPHHLGQKLFAELLLFAKLHDYHEIILDTPMNTERAHRFYEKAGFKKIEEKELPFPYHYPYQAEESDFFLLKL